RKIRRDHSLCNSCGVCDRVCPMWIDVSKKDVVRDTACISCMKCVQKCPVDALKVE
ncbi:MAG: 4Fe-4S dicluster domain-containing protein, partial [Methanosarcinales archaeon]|nr:4Fe-4S dicluster domain-containing protein [Methanosarcinales archaeon]